MEPKLKAVQIIMKMQFQKEPLSFAQGKKCALIAVDLIIYHTEEDSSNIPLYEYYSEVKKEIEKL